MSTLVIIAHIKDGADLARQHHLPQPIIDFIEQHHGTTLVEYFFHRASEQSEADPDASEVDESSFRYPGPKPQTKEAGGADAGRRGRKRQPHARRSHARAASRAWSTTLAMKRLLDGQFDECGLTLSELNDRGRQPDQVADRRLSRPREIPRSADGVSYEESSGREVEWSGMSQTHLHGHLVVQRQSRDPNHQPLATSLYVSTSPSPTSKRRIAVDEDRLRSRRAHVLGGRRHSIRDRVDGDRR